MPESRESDPASFCLIIFEMRNRGPFPPQQWTLPRTLRGPTMAPSSPFSCRARATAAKSARHCSTSAPPDGTTIISSPNSRSPLDNYPRVRHRAASGIKHASCGRGFHRRVDLDISVHDSITLGNLESLLARTAPQRVYYSKSSPSPSSNSLSALHNIGHSRGVPARHPSSRQGPGGGSGAPHWKFRLSQEIRTCKETQNCWPRLAGLIRKRSLMQDQAKHGHSM